MTRPARHRGYVLIVTLGVLVLAASVMVGVGRAAIAHALAARQAQDELQRRWAIASCRAVVLPAVEQLLADQETKTQRPVALHRAAIRLGNVALDLTLSDEQAKANVNQLLTASDQSKAQTQLRAALAGSGLSAQLRLRPVAQAAAAPTSRTASTTPATAPTTRSVRQLIFGYGQVFDDASPAQLHSGRNPPGQLITCWGGGLLNIRRAPADAIKLIATPQLTGVQISALLQAREAQWKDKPDNKKPATMPATTQATTGLLAAARITNGDGLPLTESSSCFSMWIVVRDGRREWHHLIVNDASDSNRDFVW